MPEVPSAPHPGPGQWRVDPSRSKLGFTTRNFIGMKVEGRFTDVDVDGAVRVAGDPRDSSIQVTVPVRGIDTGSRMRDRDVLKKSVFHAEVWPDMRFESTDVRADGDGRLRIAGTLRVRDQTKTIEMTAAAAHAGADEYRYTATSRLNPRDFGITHPLIRRDVEITIDVWLVEADEGAATPDQS